MWQTLNFIANCNIQNYEKRFFCNFESTSFLCCQLIVETTSSSVNRKYMSFAVVSKKLLFIHYQKHWKTLWTFYVSISLSSKKWCKSEIINEYYDMEKGIKWYQYSAMGKLLFFL